MIEEQQFLLMFVILLESVSFPANLMLDGHADERRHVTCGTFVGIFAMVL